MAASENSNMFVVLVGLVAGVGALVIAGLVYAPPYFANREIRSAVKLGLKKSSPTDSDGAIIQQINQFLYYSHTTRYWVKHKHQEQANDFHFTPDMITFDRDGDNEVDAEVYYTQTMWVPLLGKKKVFTYDYEVDGPQLSDDSDN